MADDPLELELELELELDDVVVLSGSDEQPAERAKISVKPTTPNPLFLFMTKMVPLHDPDANEIHHQQ